MSSRIHDPSEVRARIARFDGWYHRIELAPGVVSPGTNDSRQTLAQLDAIGLPQSCAGLRVLDIGCRDGFFSFEIERRGADVLAMDYTSPSATGFPIAAGILGSAVDYVTDNVYNLSPATYGPFDMVLFLGVLYHLRNPILALDRIRSVTKPGGRLYVETQISTEPLLSSATVPLWEYIPDGSLRGDPTNKWTPNPQGLRAAVEGSEFEVLKSTTSGDRGYASARAVDHEQRRYYRLLDSGTGTPSPSSG